ncbi:MAG: glycosyltransferase family 4 protein [Bacteroidota bacterium]
MTPTLAIVANSAWNLYNFRGGLIRSLREEGYPLVLLAPEGPERRQLERLGATFVALQHLRRKGLNPLRDLLLLRELYGHFRRHRVAVTLNFTIKPVIYGSLAAELAGVRNISTLTGLGYTFVNAGKTNVLVRNLYRLALRRADAVFFHNSEDRQLFVDDGLVSAAQSAVVPGSGIDLADYPQSSYAEAIPGRFLFVGRLLVDKGLREYVAAARLAKAQDPSLTFHVLGPFDPGNPAGISAAEFDLWVREGVIAYDGVAADIRPHLRRAAVVVLPSYREGCPRVLLEAAALGRAVIGADVAGVRQVVRPGESGWLVPVKDARELSRAMLLAAGSERLAAYGWRGRELITTNFSLERVVAVYRAAVGSTY